LKILKDKAME